LLSTIFNRHRYTTDIYLLKICLLITHGTAGAFTVTAMTPIG
jgi:hypothetical protein